MSDMQTLSFVRAEVQRAQHEGARKVELNIKDLLELLPHVEAGMNRERTEKRMKHAGWVSPNGMHGIRSGAENATRLRRYKTPTHNMEVFFCDKIPEKIAESVMAIAADELAKKIEVRAQEIYCGWADLPGFTPWVRRGNSIRQQQARQMAREEIEKSAGQPAGEGV